MKNTKIEILSGAYYRRKEELESPTLRTLARVICAIEKKELEN